MKRYRWWRDCCEHDLSRVCAGFYGRGKATRVTRLNSIEEALGDLKAIRAAARWLMIVTEMLVVAPVRVENAAQKFVILCRTALNLLKRDTNTKAGLKIRRRRACANGRYRARILDL